MKKTQNIENEKKIIKSISISPELNQRIIINADLYFGGNHSKLIEKALTKLFEGFWC